MNLSDSIDAILDGVRNAVEYETAGGTLSDVKTVVLGSRARPMPALPAVWIVPQAATMTRHEYDSESWSLPISLAALVKSDDAELGGRDAGRLSALALRAALQSRNSIIADVTDVTSESFDATARSTERNRALHWTEATVRVTFTVTD